MKILFIYKFLTVGGVEAVLKNRLDGLEELGIKADVWFLRYIDGEKVLSPINPRVYVGDLQSLEKHLANTSYDFISTIDTEEVFPILTKFENQSSLILESHSPYYENLEYLRFLGDLKLEAIFVPSEHQKVVVESMLEHQHEVFVVPNPLSGAFSDEIVELSPVPGKPIVAWIGRLDYLKNWKEFLLLVSHMSESDVDFEVWLVGRSTQLEVGERFYNYAHKVGILGHLRWFNNLPYSVVPEMLDMVRSSGGLVISTSRGESFGMTIVEAMARGCSVVVPDKKPFTEYVEHGETGCVYTLGDPAMGACVAGKILRDSTARHAMGEKAREKILRRHSLLSAMEVYLQSLDAIGANRKVQ
jgi:glycosyltransferase involved in cell wall biosynthesis